MDKFFFYALLILIAVFAMAVMQKNLSGKYLHYFLLLLICSITVTHIFAFNTDAEDAYIALRYVKNFVDGNGLVFNTFDKVEGYSDFLWVILIAGIHKVFHTDIPLTARYLSLLFSVIVVVYTYYLTYKLTQQKLLSYLAAFLVSVSGSFACYGLSGLENPMFAFFILTIIHLSYNRKWMWTGIMIGLIIMSRPEGFIIYLPVALYILITSNNWKERIKNGAVVMLAAAVLVIPWTLWRVSYYGYFVPNTIAAKMGMDTVYQVKSGILYLKEFIINGVAPWLLLLLVPALYFFIRKQKVHALTSDAVLIFLISIAVIFILFYSYSGGDWMPAWRFYSSLIPLFSIIIMLMWNRFVFQTGNGKLKPAWIALLFALCGIAQTFTSFNNYNTIPRVRLWSNQVNGLKLIGKWFHDCLPPNTLVATLPNGAFSYYNELPTLDYLGLTDNNVGRFGKKQKVGGWPGHIASNDEYILQQKPDIIAKMKGAGFENTISNISEFPGYDMTTFTFVNGTNPLGNYVNINIRSDRKDEIIKLLLKNTSVKLIQSLPYKITPRRSEQV